MILSGPARNSWVNFAPQWCCQIIKIAEPQGGCRPAATTGQKASSPREERPPRRILARDRTRLAGSRFASHAAARSRRALANAIQLGTSAATAAMEAVLVSGSFGYRNRASLGDHDRVGLGLTALAPRRRPGWPESTQPRARCSSRTTRPATVQKCEGRCGNDGGRFALLDRAQIGLPRSERFR